MKAKGFQVEPWHDHVYLVLVVNGVATSVRTKLSHGGGDPGRDLMSKMKKDLRFSSQRDFETFVDCKTSYVQYVEMLRDSSVIG